MQQIIQDFPGKLVDLDLPELPPVDGTNVAQRVFKDFCNHPQNNKDICDIVFCIQKQVHKNRLRVREFLEGFDLMHTGTITKNQFERALHNIGVGKYLNQREMTILCSRYMDPTDMTRIRWRIFEDEIDRGKFYYSPAANNIELRYLLIFQCLL